MDKPYIVDINKLQKDLRDVFKAHGWDPTDAYEVTKARPVRTASSKRALRS